MHASSEPPGACKRGAHARCACNECMRMSAERGGASRSKRPDAEGRSFTSARWSSLPFADSIGFSIDVSSRRARLVTMKAKWLSLPSNKGPLRRCRQSSEGHGSHGAQRSESTRRPVASTVTPRRTRRSCACTRCMRTLHAHLAARLHAPSARSFSHATRVALGSGPSLPSPPAVALAPLAPSPCSHDDATDARAVADPSR